MQLEELCVAHLPKSRAQFLDSNLKNWSEALHLDTCQRWVWVFNSKVELPVSCREIEIFKGKYAYLFLLRLAAGLESEVLGETDIFGQVKEVWRQAERQGSSCFADLSPWVQRVFEDTKEIRTQHLQNLGGTSYGSLVRKLIRNQGGLNSPLLIVGAGKIAQSIAPLLLDSELWLSNRDPMRLCAFYDDLSFRSRSQVKKIESHEEEQAWSQASHIVVCIPLDTEQDTQRIQWFKKGQTSDRSVIHLGGMKEHCSLWKEIPRFYCLNDLSALQNTLGNVRSVQITQAERACEERARLGSLGSSLSIPHGWEDLVGFA